VATGVSIAELAAALGADPLGDATLIVARPAEPAAALAGDIALAMTPAYADALRGTKAKAAIVWDGCDWASYGLKAAIAVPRARLAMAHLTQAFDTALPATGIHESAVIDAAAKIGAGASIGPFAVIGADVVIGENACVGAHVSIAAGAVLGRDAMLSDGVRIGRNVSIGDRFIAQPNAVIGADGFSFVTAEPSNEERMMRTLGKTPLAPPTDATRHRIHSLGAVVIGDDVEVGANSTVDAGTIRPTSVGRGTKIDNLVQVGHNVVLGEDCVLCAQAAVAGSARIGDRTVMGGKSGIRDNVTVGSDVVLAGGAIVLGHVAAGSFMMGYPAVPMLDHRAQQKAIRNLTQRDS